MSKKEFNELLRQVKQADLSANNPEMQAVIEHEITDWVRSYREKKQKKYTIHDCYGGPGEIPDKIPVNGRTYSPPQILEHVKARDEVGMIVIRQVDAYQKQHPMWFGNKFGEMLAKMGKSLDEVVLQCVCGQHNQTMRDVMQGIAHPNPDSIFLTAGMKDAIMRWYGAPAEYQMWDIGKRKKKANPHKG